MPPPSLSVLCFGDSLTSGYFQWGLGSHPYALKLEDRLTGSFPDVAVHVVADGLPGDVASFERFSNRAKEKIQNNHWDWVVVLGGTNDLGYGILPTKIYTHLQAVWDLQLSKGGKVLALTVPECYANSDRLDRRRDELNLCITNHVQESYYSFDLKSHIPYHSLSRDDREKYWDDGLHLKADGYDWMGGHVADALVAILRREGTLEPAGVVSRRPPPKSARGGHVYDEEAGNPRNLSEGYVVVRKRDLD